MIALNKIQTSNKGALFNVEGNTTQVHIYAIISKNGEPLFVVSDVPSGAQRYVSPDKVSAHMAKVIPLFKPAPVATKEGA